MIVSKSRPSSLSIKSRKVRVARVVEFKTPSINHNGHLIRIHIGRYILYIKKEKRFLTNVTIVI